ncbi:MAG: 50S ribosome-binding GTPase [Synergistales bacterium]|nr:50S ribosome-binding GTPase [Synergistales bacterium]
MAGRTVWYPGHMARGKRELRALAGKVDVFIEVRDARAPQLTASPDTEALSRVRPVWRVLSKRDLAEESGTCQWLDRLRSDGDMVWAANLRSGGINPLKKQLHSLAPSHRAPRLAVVGIPNVGKSRLLNLLAGKSKASIGAVPGVTKAVSWYKSKEGLLLVDSPGILDPKSGTGVSRALVWIGCTRGDVVGDYETLAKGLIDCLEARGLWERVAQRFPRPVDDGSDKLEQIGRMTGCLRPGGVVDLEQAGKSLCERFAAGRLGRCTLEHPGRTLEP